MSDEYSKALERLSPTQRQAVEWGNGAALVLAGPGVGKTTVLTARLARLLHDSPGKHFRILALTFTTKAGDEMRTRVEALVPGMTERTVIGTFHSFCSQVLRQHGSHLGIKPDFGVYDQDADRQELLREALATAGRAGEAVSIADVRWLKTIDELRSRLVGASKTAARFRDPSTGERVARVYAVYEQALRDQNIMDFNGLILDTCRLAHTVPAVAARVRQSYPYWMIDEFQDTSPAQYRMIRFLAGADFKNVFAVADDDQIIYQWAGASYKQIVAFREHFSPNLMQLVENRRCPPTVVRAANLLVSHNVERSPGKEQAVATRSDDGPAISLREFATDADEATGVAAEIAEGDSSLRGQTAILGRTRALLQPILDALRAKQVPAWIAARRDRFISPQFVWLQSCLDQSLRPNDRQVFTSMVNAGNRICGADLDSGLLIPAAEAAGISYMEHWALTLDALESPSAKRLAGFGQDLVQSRANWRRVVNEALVWLAETAASESGIVSDATEDKAAWETAARAIRAEKGSNLELAELLQGIAIRPKEPPTDPHAVSVLTIHTAKGLEFDRVWIVGMAESVLPAWQSLQASAHPAELEEERRNCFVAITRTRKTLVLSRAQSYRGWSKAPSRFIEEMGLGSSRKV